MTSDGVQIDPSDLDPVLQPIKRKSKNVREARALLQFLGYYRSFIQDFSRIACPLFKLQESPVKSNKSSVKVKSPKQAKAGGQLPSKTTVQWTMEHSTAPHLLDMLTNPPHLGLPRL